MVRRWLPLLPLIMGSPHTRGDGPSRCIVSIFCPQFSPHAWGWSARRPFIHPVGRVLPTRVGMVRLVSASIARESSSPHTRGDGPAFCSGIGCGCGFSPHAWGWSVRSSWSAAVRFVLPTRVGMVRMLDTIDAWCLRSPHTRGDGPPSGKPFEIASTFSPHAWGWSGFSDFNP